jgi:hypothetical protein
MALKCFLVERLPLYSWYFTVRDGVCPTRTDQPHRGRTEAGTFGIGGSPEWPPYDDPMWPKTCINCGLPLRVVSENCHAGGDPHYRRMDNNERIIGKLPAGAMFFEIQDYLPKGEDGKSLVVVLPSANLHHWNVDSRASNCTVPCKCGKLYSEHDFSKKTGCERFIPIDNGNHRCWVRHGQAPLITVDKAGLTCGAGAGSIQADGWHGFLKNGELA